MDEKKHIVVTGATSGIGEETALALAKTGAKIVIIGRTDAKCQAVIDRINAKVNKNGTRNFAFIRYSP
ncbi:MAG: SDR family NAD(P)-dependent oxidoreductase [Chloroflexota bacterium]